MALLAAARDLSGPNGTGTFTTVQLLEAATAAGPAPMTLEKTLTEQLAKGSLLRVRRGVYRLANSGPVTAPGDWHCARQVLEAMCRLASRGRPIVGAAEVHRELKAAGVRFNYSTVHKALACTLSGRHQPGVPTPTVPQVARVGRGRYRLLADQPAPCEVE